MIKEKIQHELAKIIQTIYDIKLESKEIQVDPPTVASFGDYTSNISLKVVNHLSPQHKSSPLQIAKRLSEMLLNQDSEKKYQHIESIAPGFLNITLAPNYLYQSLISTVEQDLVAIKTDNPIKILVEHTGPNTNKPLHIGHIRNATTGTAILNILKAQGHIVIAANINNDRGIHIIKSMYGYLKYCKTNQQDSTERLNYDELLSQWIAHPDKWHNPTTLKMKPDHLVGHYYILGNNDYEDSEKKALEHNTNNPTDPHNQMQQMLLAWEAEEPHIRKLWKQNNDWFYQGMHQTLRSYGIKSPNDPTKFFDKEWYESEIYKQGRELVLQKLGNGIIQEFEDGHVEAILDKYKLPNMVLLRKNKTSLYIIQDIEMLRQRIKEDLVDIVMYLTDTGQNLRFAQLFAVAESLDIAPISQMIHLGYGTVRLPEGKMSSRKGNVIQGDQLLLDVQQKAKEKINQERTTYTAQDIDEISNTVSIAAIKYGILKYNTLSNITFDIQSNISFEGDTGPYIQYTHARGCSILQKYKSNTNMLQLRIDIEELQKTNNLEEEITLLKQLYKFPETILSSAKNYTPNYLCEYLFNLSQKFNLLYSNKQILTEPNEHIRLLRLQLTNKTVEVIKHGLALLGIEAPERM